MFKVSVRYCQHKPGQKLHIAPSLGNTYNMADVSLCGKRVKRWRATFNVPMNYVCKNCLRVNRRRGRDRAMDIIKAALEK
jgi:hypothetical protein